MQKLESVEFARKLMTEANSWSPWQWLNEKQRVREAADRANQALDDALEAARRSWSEQLRGAYLQLQAAEPHNGETIDPGLRGKAASLTQSEKAASDARKHAEQAFSDAERSLSISMAREGAQLAIEAWKLREKVIDEFEAAAESKQER